MAGLEPVSSAVDILATVATTINGINDVNTRRKFEQNLSALSLDQQKALNTAMINANSESQRLAILGQVLGGTSQSRISALAQIQSEKEKTKKIVTVSIILGLVVIAAIVLTLQKK